MNAELLYEALNDQHSLEQLNRQELDRLVTAHPYFSIGQLLLAKKYRQERDEDSYQIQRACVQTFYRNPWWLYYQLELSDNAPAVPRSPYAPGYVPEIAPFETIARQPVVPAVQPGAHQADASRPGAVVPGAPNAGGPGAGQPGDDNPPSADEPESPHAAYPLFPTASGGETNQPIPGQSHAFVPWPDLDEPIAPTLAAAIAPEAPAAGSTGAEAPEVPTAGSTIAEAPVMPFMVTPVLPGGEPEPAEQPAKPAAPAEQPVLPSEAPEREPGETPETAPAELPSRPEQIPERPEGAPPETKTPGPEEIPNTFPREGAIDTPNEIPQEAPGELPRKIPEEMPSPSISPEMPGFPGTRPGAEPEAVPAAASAPAFPFSITPLNTGLTFEPLHTVDYFASQGIRLSVIDENGTDKLSQHLKSFTEWLRTMKRINPTEPIREELDTATEAEIQHLASGANRQREAVVTESMAQVWVQQGKIHKAVEVYNKLSLQHPEKRAYFAAKIEQLNKQ